MNLLPTQIERGSDLKDMIDIGDYTRAVAMAQVIESRPNVSARELALLGKAELAAGRVEDARRHLRVALELRPPHNIVAEIAWDLSQVEYLSNNYAAAEDWARMASRMGIGVKQWHINYLASLATTATYQLEPGARARVPMNFGHPNIPRVEVVLNGDHAVTGVIDSGAVLSIISEQAASRLGVRALGPFKGEFFGLLGEPILVSFGLLESVSFGTLVITNVPVAIMPNKSLDFFILNREPFRMDFLIGANLLKHFRVELDFRSQEMLLVALSDEDRQPAADQNLFFLDARPLVHTAINRRGWYLFVLDTGSEVTFLNQESLALARIRNATRLHGATLQGLGGARKRGEKIENVEIGIGNWQGKFRDIPLYSNESTNALGIIGQDFMKNFRVVIDFGKMKLELHRDRMFGGF